MDDKCLYHNIFKKNFFNTTRLGLGSIKEITFSSSTHITIIYLKILSIIPLNLLAPEIDR